MGVEKKTTSNNSSNIIAFTTLVHANAKYNTILDHKHILLFFLLTTDILSETLFGGRKTVVALREVKRDDMKIILCNLIHF